MTITSQFADMMSSSNFFTNILFLLSSLVTGLNFMSLSSLVLEFWQFSFIRDWPEIRKYPVWVFWVLANLNFYILFSTCACIILYLYLPRINKDTSSSSGDWGELGIPNGMPHSLCLTFFYFQNRNICHVLHWDASLLKILQGFSWFRTHFGSFKPT